MKKASFRIVIMLFFYLYSSVPANSQGTPLWLPLNPNNSSIYNTNNSTNGYVGIGTGTGVNYRYPAITKLQLYMPYNATTDHDRLSIILEAGMDQSCHAVGELAVAKTPYIYPNNVYYSSIATAGDVVLRTGGIFGFEEELSDCSEDLILTTRKNNGRIRFATTPTEPVPNKDFERMTILPNGNVGIATNNPLHLLDVRGTISTGLSGKNGTVTFYPSGNGAWYHLDNREGWGFNITGGIKPGYYYDPDNIPQQGNPPQGITDIINMTSWGKQVGIGCNPIKTNPEDVYQFSPAGITTNAKW